MNDIFKLLILSAVIDDCGTFLPFCERRCFPINPPCLPPSPPKAPPCGKPQKPCRPTYPPSFCPPPNFPPPCEPFYPCPPYPPCDDKPCPPHDKWDLPHYMKSERDC